MNKLIWAALGTAVGVAAATVVHTRYKSQIDSIVSDLENRAEEFLARLDEHATETESGR